MPGQGCGGLWRVPKGSSGFRDVSVQMRAEGSGISGRFRKVPASSGAVARSRFRRFREVPGSSGARCGAKFRRVLEGSERGPRISGADAYCHVKDELHERGLVPQEG